MANQKVNELTTQTPSLSDFLLGIGASAGSTEYKMLINDLAKAIIEQYTGSSVAGSAQTIKAALDALNSNTMGYFPLTRIPSGSDLNTIFYGSYFCNENALDATITNKPPGATTVWRLYVTSITKDGYESPSAESAWIKRIQTFMDDRGNTFTRTISKGASSSATVFGDWIKQPTRAEVDGLSNKIGTATIKQTGIANGSSGQIALESGTRGTILFAGVGTNAAGIYSFGVNSSGVVSGSWLYEATRIALDISESNTCSVTNTSGAYVTATVIY